MQRILGLLLIAVSAVAFGFLAIFIRAAYADGAGTLTILFLRFAVAGAIMLAVMRLRGLRFPAGRTRIALLLMGGLGYVGQSFSYFTALKHASASLVALLLYSFPAMVSLVSVLVFKERLTAGKAAALGLSLAGCGLIVGLGGGAPAGVAFGLAAAVIYSAFILTGSRVIPVGKSLESSTLIVLSAAAVFALLTGLSGFEPPAGPGGWAAVLAIALVATVLAMLTFFAGLARVGPSTASMVSTLEPVVTVAAASIFLGEALTPLNLAGGACIMAALALLGLPEGKPAGEAAVRK